MSRERRQRGRGGRGKTKVRELQKGLLLKVKILPLLYSIRQEDVNSPSDIVIENEGSPRRISRIFKLLALEAKLDNFSIKNKIHVNEQVKFQL